MFKLLCLGFLLSFTADVQTRTYYVSKDGSDLNSGAQSSPFKTIGRAKDQVRLDIAAGLNKNISVKIGAGIYILSEPLVFDHNDSGNGDYTIRYEALDSTDIPSITGGKSIGRDGWVNESSNIWYTLVPEVTNNNWMFRELYVDSEKQTRSREPDINLNNGFVYGDWAQTVDPQYASQVIGERTIDSPSMPEVTGFSNELRTIFSSSMSFPVVTSNDYAEIITWGPWSSSRVLIQSVSNHIVQSSSRVGISGVYANDLVVGRDFYLEHAKSFLDSEKEWWLDVQAGRLYYYSSSDPSEKRFWAPYADQLLKVEGTVTDPVENLEFTSLKFQGGNWKLPLGGYIGIQAHFYRMTDGSPYILPSAISFSYVTNCSFVSNTLRMVAANGISMGKGARGSRIEWNELHDIGGTAVIVGDANPNEKFGSDAEGSSDIYIRRNTIDSFGAEQFGCVGIWSAFSPSTRIAYNKVANGGYTGISIGSDWTDVETRQRDVTVDYNEVFNVMKYYHDGSGIYALGNQGMSYIRRNYIHGNKNGNGIQCDAGSCNINIIQNVVDGVGKHGLMLNPGYNRVVRYNIFSGVGECVAVLSQRNLYPTNVCLRFERNIFYGTDQWYLMGSVGVQLLKDTNAEFIRNLYYSPQHSAFSFAGQAWSEWQQDGRDVYGYVDEDPGFVDVESGSFEFVNANEINALIEFSDWTNKCQVGPGY